MSKDSIRLEILEELRAGHLMTAMKLFEEDSVARDAEIREAAVTACIGSLRKHFHYVVPAFIHTFGIVEDGRLNALAGKIIMLAFRNGQPILGCAVARTFKIQLDAALEKRAEEAQAEVLKSMDRGSHVVLEGDDGEYRFTLEAAHPTANPSLVKEIITTTRAKIPQTNPAMNKGESKTWWSRLWSSLGALFAEKAEKCAICGCTLIRGRKLKRVDTDNRAKKKCDCGTLLCNACSKGHTCPTCGNRVNTYEH